MDPCQKCLVCLISVGYGPSPNTKFIKKNDADDCQSVKQQLPVIFLLRKFLDIPSDICTKFLHDYGDPSVWVHCCDSCSILVKKARDVFDQITLLQQRFEKLQAEFKNSIVLSVKSPHAVYFGDFEKGATGIVRKLVADVICENIEYSRTTLEDIKVELSVQEGEDSHSDFNAMSPEQSCSSPDENSSDSGEWENYCKKILPKGKQVSKTLSSSSTNLNKRNLASIEDKSRTDFSEKSPGELQNNKKIKSLEEDVDLFLKCTTCGKSFENAQALKDHVRAKHSEEKEHKCRVCDEIFPKWDDLQTHLKTSNHLIVKSFECRPCGKQFSTATKLNRHMKIHTEEKAFPCQMCPFRFRDSSALKVHMRTHTGERPYKCDLCDQSFRESINLRMHKRMHGTSFKCFHCEKVFMDEKELKVHFKIHNSAYSKKCGYCGKLYKTESGLKVHERIHTGVEPYKCEFCGRTFRQTISLQVHRRTHTGETPYKCEFCGKGFKQSSHLGRHKKTHKIAPDESVILP